jgi:hypothetical protein
MAKSFGVSVAVVCDIRNGKRWPHLPEPTDSMKTRAEIFLRTLGKWAMKPGRPKLPQGRVRVPFNARVKPETKRNLEKIAKNSGLPVGRYLDAMFRPTTNNIHERT